MEKLVIASHAEFAEHIGKELGVSEYLKIDQERINVFADATLDHQWIHTDPERAKSEGGFGNTIAHGYLTLSILPHLWEQIADIRNIKMMINYGIERLKFNQPVVADSEVRLRVKLTSLADLRGITKCQLNVKLEIKDNPKPAFTGEMIFLYHFA
ncbi:MaoC family dehydratase [Roseivirga echinicomitans]|mgnify:FL=1|uniref:Acyl dehydratase n=1 Tax=Roseivirga echinicomitans TaxID=296218 RepID=A0A150XK91_9BACT|nr:MaoC family dehydratase [Roseivirga echinicomitans]KYG79136.1 acyl dehydratase [Roseivirga echinicomitans]|tara:strand:+ start:39512 stop:39976 length:465 start_codon:yes stop_codon:yes gene_type:complete